MDNIKGAQARAGQNRDYKKAAILQRTEGLLWDDLDTMALGATGDESTRRVRERELENNVKHATTAEMKRGAQSLLDRFQEMGELGHTPVATPRGGRFMVRDYERPRSAANNCLIDLLPPDTSQISRGTLPREQMRLFMDKYRPPRPNPARIPPAPTPFLAIETRDPAGFN